VESQAAIFHGQAGPRLFHEFGLADDLTLATDQNAENVERPATKLSSSAIAFQAASMRKDTERSEGKRLRHRLSWNKWSWSAAVRHRSHVFSFVYGPLLYQIPSRNDRERCLKWGQEA
jgi:hypothetical protein